jgi:hypothetical protein
MRTPRGVIIGAGIVDAHLCCEPVAATRLVDPDGTALRG